MPIFYECDRCAACCRWPGQVRLRDVEIRAMAEFLQMEEIQFVREYTRLRSDRSGLALTDQANGECVFLEAGACRVQAVKPQQCRNFPNLWNFPGFQKICQAKEKVLDEASYSRAVLEATGVCLRK